MEQHTSGKIVSTSFIHDHTGWKHHLIIASPPRSQAIQQLDLRSLVNIKFYTGDGDDSDFLSLAEESYSEATKVGSRVLTITMPLNSNVTEMAVDVAKNWKDFMVKNVRTDEFGSTYRVVSQQILQKFEKIFSLFHYVTKMAQNSSNPAF